MPQVGKLLLSWRHPLPGGFRPFNGRADGAWAGPEPVSLPGGRGIAFNNLTSMDPPQILALAIHEAFHSFERAAGDSGRFGAWENAILTGRYPVFAVENEAAFAIEAALLRVAVEAPDLATARLRAREFLAVRHARRDALPPEFARYEADTEINEGLAQYAQFRGLELLAERGVLPPAHATAMVARELALLDEILTVDRRSVRRRFYATGTALGRLLDRLSGDAWKLRLMRDTADVTQVLADAVNERAAERSAQRRRGIARMDAPALRARAEQLVAELAARRDAQRDSVLMRPGVVLSLPPTALPGGRWQWCGFDPQNLLQLADGTLLHMGFLRACAGAGLEITVASGTVEAPNGTLHVHAGERVTLSAGGDVMPLPQTLERRRLSDVRLEAPGITLRVPVATVWRDEGGRIVIVAGPAP